MHQNSKTLFFLNEDNFFNFPISKCLFYKLIINQFLFRNQPDITEFLLQKNANINSVNKNGCTSLHVAVNKQHTNCVRVLLKYKCDVNIQDSYGDTALHDIISKEITKESKIIVDMLLATPSINLSLRNKRGFNILQYASLKGNYMYTQIIITNTNKN